MVDLQPAEGRARLIVTRALALAGFVLLLLSVLADHGRGPLTKTWSQVATGTGLLLSSPLWFIGPHIGGVHRRLDLTAGLLAVLVGGVALVTGLLATLR